MQKKPFIEDIFDTLSSLKWEDTQDLAQEIIRKHPIALAPSHGVDVTQEPGLEQPWFDPVLAGSSGMGSAFVTGARMGLPFLGNLARSAGSGVVSAVSDLPGGMAAEEIAGKYPSLALPLSIALGITTQAGLEKGLSKAAGHFTTKHVDDAFIDTRLGKRSGATFDINKETPTLWKGKGGYVVSVKSKEADPTKLNPVELQDFIKESKPLAKEFPELKGGIYAEHGDAPFGSYDLNLLYKSEAKAIDLGKRFNQKAIWDDYNKQVVEVGGTGKTPPDITPDEIRKVIKGEAYIDAEGNLMKVNPEGVPSILRTTEQNISKGEGDLRKSIEDYIKTLEDSIKGGKEKLQNSKYNLQHRNIRAKVIESERELEKAQTRLSELRGVTDVTVKKAYRSETGYTHGREDTALDVVKYETDELGNDIKVSKDIYEELRGRPATDVVWVTKTKKDAARYGDPTEYELPKGSVIIGEDGEGGYLVLKGGLGKISTASEQNEVKAGSLAFGQDLPEEKIPGVPNLQYVDSEYAAKKLLLDTAEKYNLTGKEVEPWTKTQADADSLGISLKDIGKSKPPHVSTQAWTQAHRDLLTDTANRAEALRRSLAAKIGDKDIGSVLSVEDMAMHEMALQQLAGIIKVAKGQAAEAGRTLNIFKKASSARATIKNYEDLLTSLGGKKLTIDKLQKFMTLDMSNPIGVAKFISEVADAKTSDKVFEVWINGLLTNPVTHAANLIGNTLALFFKTTMETPVRAAFGHGYAAESLQHVKGIGEVVGAAGKAGKQAFSASQFGMWQGMKEGARAILRSIESQLPAEVVLTSKLEQTRRAAIKGKLGQAVRLPGTFLEMSDNFFKAIVYRGEINAQAYRAAKAQGLKGTAMQQRMAELINDPTPGMMKHAIQEAKYRTYTDTNKVATAITGVKTAVSPLRYVLPFTRTPVNIAKYSLERTPLALPFALAKKGAERKEALARVTVGSLLASATMMLAAEGHIVGGMGKNKQEKETRYEAGKLPYSIKIGDKYYSFARLEPIGSIMGMAADLKEAIDRGAKEGEIDDIASQMVMSITKNLTSKTFLSGIVGMMDAFSDPERYGESFLSKLAGSVVPSVVAGAARAIDPVMRRVDSPLDVVKSRIPGVSQKLLPKINKWGEETQRTGTAASRFLSPVETSPESKDPLKLEVERLMDKADLKVGKVTAKMGGEKLTPEQHNLYLKETGTIAKEIITRFVSNPTYQKLGDQQKSEMIDRIYDMSARIGRLKALGQFDKDTVERIFANRMGIQLDKK